MAPGSPRILQRATAVGLEGSPQVLPIVLLAQVITAGTVSSRCFMLWDIRPSTRHLDLGHTAIPCASRTHWYVAISWGSTSRMLPDVHASVFAPCIVLRNAGFPAYEFQLKVSAPARYILPCIEAVHMQQGDRAATRSKSAPPAPPRFLFSPCISACARALPARSAREMSVGDRLRREAALVGLYHFESRVKRSA